MKNMKQKLIVLVGLLLLLSSFKADKPVITIFMIGDSTMADKDLTGGNPERGWGQMLPGFLSEEVRVDNHAVNDYFRHIVYDGIILLFHGHGLLPE